MTINICDALDFFNKEREPDSHKGDYGRAAILGGVRGMTGAGILCARAALHAGAGLVYIGAREGTLGIYETCVPEAVKKEICEPEAESVKLFASHMDSLVIGPGMGRSIASREIVTGILLDGAYFDEMPPVILDADGLNSIAGFPEILRKGANNASHGIVITPHEQEAARLLGKTAEYVHENRYKACEELFEIMGGRGIVVLKGHRTLVMSSRGIYENTTGNAGMATGGSGDVLAGMLAGFIAADGDSTDIAEIVEFGVCLHGLCGDIAANRYGQRFITAQNIIDAMGELKGELNYDEL